MDYPPKSSTIGTILILKRISAWVSVGIIAAISTLFTYFAYHLYHIGVQINHSNNTQSTEQWCDDSSFQLFRTLYLRLFCCFMLLIGLIYSGVSASLHFTSSIVWLDDAVFYPLKVTIEHL